MVEALCLDLEDLKQSKSDGIRERESERESREREREMRERELELENFIFYNDFSSGPTTSPC